ncbi:MAG: GNAT family N-acetyltransferase [Chloroflexi bacterium]|nr:GNAT family N-acetyltransferase [Chloroflexota bacterium]
MLIRQPRVDEIDAVRALFDDEVRAGRMLPRRAEDIRARLGDWLIAEEDGQVIGCVSLVIFNETVCELRSLAVSPLCRGRGIGGELINAVLELARKRGLQQVLALTRAVPVFERMGFRHDFVSNFPDKVWRDCAPCPFKNACDEVALVFELCPQPEEMAV